MGGWSAASLRAGAGSGSSSRTHSSAHAQHRQRTLYLARPRKASSSTAADPPSVSPVRAESTSATVPAPLLQLVQEGAQLRHLPAA